MPKFIVTCSARATIKERWRVEAPTADAAEAAFDDPYSNAPKDFLDQVVVGEETERTVTEVENEL